MNINVVNVEIVENLSIMNLPTKEEKQIQKRDTVYRVVKRVMDVTIASIAMIVLSPIFAIIAIAVKMESEGPVFFKHTRIGKDGKIIKLYKFRSMVINAEELIKSFTPEQMKEYKENYKLTNDPRITKIGKFLRKTSLDELPQLINIIKGDLAIIGPRPVIAEELKKYGDNIDKFLSVTPGLTGYWAANGRSNTTYEQRMQMELYYIDNMSLKMDIQVFFKTILSVVKKEGAI